MSLNNKRIPCINCDSLDMEVKEYVFDIEIGDCLCEISADAYVCTHCNTPIMDGDQMNVLRAKVRDFKAT